MKKIINSFILFLCLFTICFNVKADNIESSKVSSLNISYQYDTIMISNTPVSLYFIAKIDDIGNYQFDQDYIELSFDPGQLTSSETILKAEEFCTYIKKEQKSVYISGKTNQGGNIHFSNLVPGLYLVTVDNKVLGEYRYDASPLLLTIPTMENGIYQYDVLVNLKTKREKIEQVIIPPGVTDSGERVPNTLDSIFFYVGLLIISMLVIFGVIIYIFKKKGENKNEKKK